jgi:hypothetical protein
MIYYGPAINRKNWNEYQESTRPWSMWNVGVSMTALQNLCVCLTYLTELKKKINILRYLPLMSKPKQKPKVKTSHI